MTPQLSLVLHPPPEVERLDTSLRFTDILFGFVIKELFIRLQNWADIAPNVRAHLVVASILVLGSWIGYRRSLNRSHYQLKFFNLPLCRFVTDQLMLILYFRISVLTHIDGKVLSPPSLAMQSMQLLVLVFLLYFVWDALGGCPARC